MQSRDNMSSKKPVLLATIVCGLASLFYLYEFILQVSPGVLTNELMHAFAIDAAGVGVISGFYYYSYTPMQLPAGLLFDRFGPRLLITIAILLCVAGALFFGMTTSAFLASMGRFLMGIGSAFSFIGALLLISRWFPPKQFALLAGITQTMSSVGAIGGEAPLAAAVAHFGWRQSIVAVGVVGIVLALFVWLIVRDQPPWKQKGPSYSEKSSLKGLQHVIAKPQTWWVALYSFASWAPVLVFAVLWGIPFIAKIYNISTVLAATPMMMVWIGIGIGSPLIGWWSDHIGRRNLPLVFVQIFGLIAIIAILYMRIPFYVLYILLFMMGIAASGQSLAFGVVKDINHPKCVGTAIGFNNMAVVAGGALLQPLAGLLLRFYWDGEMAHGVQVYSISAYQHAMAVLPLLYVLTIIVGKWFIKETHCKDVHQNEDIHYDDNTVARVGISSGS
ncbi:MAG: MFS transporter [Gammaproteobacteria bacterium]